MTCVRCWKSNLSAAPVESCAGRRTDPAMLEIASSSRASLTTMGQSDPPARSEFRWAIGSSDGLRSSAWRLWGNPKGDIYVAIRSHGAKIKASFHRDGKCQFGFTQDYAAARGLTGPSRHWQTWRLPADPVVRVLQVMVPHSDLRPLIDRKPQDLTWLPTPPEGSLAVASIFVTTQATALQLVSCPPGTIVVGKVPTSIRTAWLVYAHTPIDAAMAEQINVARAKFHDIPVSRHWPREALWESKAGHDRHVLELASD